MSRTARARPGGSDDEQGSVLLLVIGYAVIAAMLVVVLVDVSAVVLARRALQAAADAAALRAAQSLDVDAYYRGSGADLPLDPGRVTRTVAAYAALAELPRRFPGFSADAGTDGTVASVTFRAVVRLPLAGVLGSRYAAGVAITAGASARAPYRP